MTRSLDYPLPFGWQNVAIGKAYRFTRKPKGMRASALKEVPFIPMEFIPIEKTYVHECITRLTESLGSGTYFENGDLLVAKITPSFENGKQAIAQIDAPFGYATTEVIPIQEIEGVSNKHYLYFALLHPSIRNELAGKMDGSTGRQRLRKEVLASKQIPLPPLREQTQIVRVLNSLRTAIEQQSRLIDLTQELKTALMQKLFTEGLRSEPQKETEIGLIPKSWHIAKLKDVSEKPQYGYTDSAQDRGSARFLRITDIQEFGVTWDKVPFCDCPVNQIPKYLLKDGDLVFARIGATTGKSFVITKPPKAVFASYLIRIRPESKQLDSGFLGFFCQTRQYWAYINSHKGNNLKGGVNSGILQEMLVPLPMIEEQKRIASVLHVLDEKISFCSTKRKLLEELFRTLLHKLMTGEIRVNDLDIPEI